MKTVITKCDQCLAIINTTDVLTGIKYVPTYVKYELNLGGIKREFCSMVCLESLIHAGSEVGVNAGVIGSPPTEETAHLPPGFSFQSGNIKSGAAKNIELSGMPMGDTA